MAAHKKLSRLTVTAMVLLAGSLCNAEPGLDASPPVADSPAADSKAPVADHLALGQAYLDRGEYARAVQEFEQVLRFDNLPPDLRQQAEIYAKAARNYRERKPLSGFGFAEIWLGWTRAMLDGKAALTITLNERREWATQDRAEGDQTFYGATIDWGMDFNDRLGAFLFGLWKHNGYHEDIPYYDEAQRTLSPDLDIYELGGGLTYALGPGWSLLPEVVYIRDEGDTQFSDYSATKVWINVRKSF